MFTFTNTKVWNAKLHKLYRHSPLLERGWGTTAHLHLKDTHIKTMCFCFNPNFGHGIINYLGRYFELKLHIHKTHSVFIASKWTEKNI